MNIEIALVPPGKYTIWLTSLVKYLRKSEAWTRGRAKVDDIVRFLFTGQMLLWVFYDHDTSQGLGFMITEIKQYPQCKALVIQYCAGEIGAMAEVDTKMHDLLEEFAKKAGCSIIEYYGRPGWRKDARKHGFLTESILFEKYLD